MKIGLQTIVWGTTFQDMNSVVGVARQLGYEGLEFGQIPERLGPASDLRRLLADNEIYPVGLTGGSLQSQIEYGEQLRPYYLCTDVWDQAAVISASEKGLRVGIHPHIYKTLETIRDADRYLREYPKLGLILDTGHQYLADDDILEAIGNYHDRILAVHLKDWNSRYGRSPFRYARGFCPLGTGKLHTLLEKTIKRLIGLNFDGWIIVEHETPYVDAMDCAKVSREWLRAQGV